MHLYKTSPTRRRASATLDHTAPPQPNCATQLRSDEVQYLYKRSPTQPTPGWKLSPLLNPENWPNPQATKRTEGRKDKVLTPNQPRVYQGEPPKVRWGMGVTVWRNKWSIYTFPVPTTVNSCYLHETTFKNFYFCIVTCMECFRFVSLSLSLLISRFVNNSKYCKSVFVSTKIHTHTHTHIYIYIKYWETFINDEQALLQQDNVMCCCACLWTC